MSNKKKTEAEIKKDKEMDEKAELQARAYLKKDELVKEKRKLEEREKRLKKFKREKKKCSDKEEDFHIKIKYKCESVCGKKYYTFNNVKAEYPFIDKNDIVLYDNQKHPNHNREAVVINYEMGNTGNADIEKSKTRPYFLIKFIEPLDKLPFYYLDVNGLKVKTNKKIVVIERVAYENLKLTYSVAKSDHICLSKEKIKKNEKNIGNILKEQFDGKGFNAPLNFKEIIKNIFVDTQTIIKKIDNGKKIKNKKTIFKINKEFKIKLKLLINYLKKFNPEEPLKNKKKEFIKIITYFNTVLNFNYDTTFLEKSNEHLKSNKELIIYIFIYDLLLKSSKKNLAYITEFKDNTIEGVNNEDIKGFIAIIKKIQKNLEDVKNLFIKKYNDTFKNDPDKNIEKKIMKIVIKNLVDIKKGIEIKPYTYKHFIMDELKLKVLKYFKIGEVFKPPKVFFKYANPELVKLDLKEKFEKENDVEEQFIKINKNNKLVNPTSDKIFILTNINSVFNKNKEKKINDIDDYFDNNVKINIKNNQIEIKLDIGLTIKDKKSKDVLFEDKTKQTEFFKNVKSLVNSFQDNMECTKSKENIKKDIKDIKKKFGIMDDENKLDTIQEDTSTE